MNYYELVFTLVEDEDYQQDLLINALAEIGFDTFEETDFGFKAYIASDNFHPQLIDSQLDDYKSLITFSYETNLIPHKNWNEVWESNFKPIEIKDAVYVRANFHAPNPKFKHEILINPKMAFGTGHHQTTSMIMEYLIGDEKLVVGKSVLDMGCGTGILAILASKLGATEVVAIDNDLICYESVLENTHLNKVDNVSAICGSKEAIPAKKFDLILANINRNILLDQMIDYANVMKKDSLIFFSGFYENPDLQIITDAAEKHSLKYIDHQKKENWVAAKFVKCK